MKIKLVLAVAFGMFAFAGIAQAAGLFDNRPAGAAALMHRAEALTRSTATARFARRGPRGFRGPQGPRGPQGTQGVPGSAGPKGAFSTVTQVSGPSTTLCGYEYECSIGTAHAECPAGSRVVSGGFSGLYTGEVFFQFASGNGWSVGAANWSTVPLTSFHATAICVT